MTNSKLSLILLVFTLFTLSMAGNNKLRGNNDAQVSSPKVVTVTKTVTTGPAKQQEDCSDEGTVVQTPNPPAAVVQTPNPPAADSTPKAEEDCNAEEAGGSTTSQPEADVTSEVVIVKAEEDCNTEEAVVQTPNPPAADSTPEVVIVKAEEDCNTEEAVVQTPNPPAADSTPEVVIVKAEEDCSPEEAGGTTTSQTEADVTPEVVVVTQPPVEENISCNVNADIEVKLNTTCTDASGQACLGDAKSNYRLKGQLEIEIVRDGKTYTVTKDVDISG